MYYVVERRSETGDWFTDKIGNDLEKAIGHANYEVSCIPIRKREDFTFMVLGYDVETEIEYDNLILESPEMPEADYELVISNYSPREIAENLFENQRDEPEKIDIEEAKRLIKEFDIDSIEPSDLMNEYNYLVEKWL